MNSYLENSVAEPGLDGRLSELEARVSRLAAGGPRTAGISFVVFSGELDKLLSAFMLANAAASLGAPVTMFFTFWGLAALKRQTVYRRKSAAERLMGAMLPAGPRQLNPSRGSLLGLGRRFLGALLQRKHMENLEGLRRQARELKVRMVACEAVMQMMGVTRDELIEGVEFGGAVSFLDEALGRSATLFI